MSAHTPGPWLAECREDGSFDVSAESGGHGGGYYIVTSRRQHELQDETHTNARLIAAAPELLAALQGLSSGMGEGTEYEVSHMDFMVAMHWIRKARAAIAKVTRIAP